MGENLLSRLCPQWLNMPLHSLGPGPQLGSLSQQPPPLQELHGVSTWLCCCCLWPLLHQHLRERGRRRPVWRCLWNVVPPVLHRCFQIIIPETWWQWHSICLPILLYGPASCQNNSTWASSVFPHWWSLMQSLKQPSRPLSPHAQQLWYSSKYFQWSLPAHRSD